MIGENGKPVDTEAEVVLRRLVEALQQPYFFNQRGKGLEAAMNEARWYIERKDACEFKSDNGNGCGRPAVRVSYSIPCCEEHAKLRDYSLR